MILGLGIVIVVLAPFIIHADWGAPSPSLLLAAFCIVFPVIVRSIFVPLAFASSTELRLHPATGCATRIMRGPLLRGHETHSFSALQSPALIMRDSEDGPYPILRMRLPRWPVVEMSDFSGRSEAKKWQARITELLAKA